MAIIADRLNDDEVSLRLSLPHDDELNGGGGGAINSFQCLYHNNQSIEEMASRRAALLVVHLTNKGIALRSTLSPSRLEEKKREEGRGNAENRSALPRCLLTSATANVQHIVSKQDQ